MTRYIYSILILIFFSLNAVWAQDTINYSAENSVAPKLLFEQAENLHKKYKFADAAEIYRTLANNSALTTDTIERAKLGLIACENALNMLNFVSQPKVEGKIKVSKKSFLLYYDVIKNGYFATRPESMYMDSDKGLENELPLVFFPDSLSANKDIIFFSSYGKYGNAGLDIYSIKRIDGNRWGEPERLSDSVNTPFDETFPILSEDGKTLYFTSNGHYGMGDFDIFKSVYDDVSRTWSRAENIGFPLSSPFNDMVFVPDNSNTYACFASTRNCSSDSIYVYKIKVAVNPDFMQVSDIAEIEKLSELNVSKTSEKNSDNNIEINIKDLSNNADYVAMLTAASNYNKQFNDSQQLLDDMRDNLFDADSIQRETIEKQIVAKENELYKIQAMVSELSLAISKAEYNYVTKGVQPTMSDSLKSYINNDIAEKEEKKRLNSFGATYAENVHNTSPQIEMMEARITERDMYVFRVGVKTLLQNDYPLPEGLVYKIKVGTFANDVDVSVFKNCSPVTSDFYNNSRRYYIGMFKKYADAENALQTLKNLDFKTPIIVAWNNGKNVSISQAKNIENGVISPPKLVKQPNEGNILEKSYMVSIVLKEAVESKIQLITRFAENKDISKRENEDGDLVYSIGIFYTFEQADSVKNQLIENGLIETKVEEIVPNPQQTEETEE